MVYFLYIELVFQHRWRKGGRGGPWPPPTLSDFYIAPPPPTPLSYKLMWVWPLHFDFTSSAYVSSSLKLDGSCLFCSYAPAEDLKSADAGFPTRPLILGVDKLLGALGKKGVHPNLPPRSTLEPIQGQTL